jgi:hypothetical protein
MELTVEVIGMKAFKGNVQGDAIDSGKLFARTKLNERNNREGELFAKGEAIEEWRLPNSEAVFRMKHLPLPFMCKLDIERVSNGKETKEIVIEARPVERALDQTHQPGQVRKVA